MKQRQLRNRIIFQNSGMMRLRDLFKLAPSHPTNFTITWRSENPHAYALTQGLNGIGSSYDSRDTLPDRKEKNHRVVPFLVRP